jgi:uncharacterized delta-60 repeat protein
MSQIILLSTLTFYNSFPYLLNLKRAIMKHKNLLMVLVTISCTNAFAQSFDQTFGVNGKVVTNIGGYQTYIKSSAIQQDGKILIGGNDADEDGYVPTRFFARYNADGSYDNTFATKYRKGSVGEFIAIESDGKIVTAGGTTDRHEDIAGQLELNRYFQNGNIDPGFALTEVFSPATGLALQHNDKPLVWGRLYDQTNTINIVVRFLLTGAIDKSFGTNGSIRGTTQYEQFATDLKILPDDKIIVAYQWGTYPYSGALVKYTSNGVIDNSFGTNGIVTLTTVTENIALRTDGKILVRSYQSTSPNYEILSRYNANGTIDNSFGGNGKIRVLNALQGTPFTVDSAGGILLAASVLTGGFSQPAVQRILTNGIPDSAFGDNGFFVIPFEDYPPAGTYGFTGAKSMLVQPNGKVVVSGTAIGIINGLLVNKAAMARFSYTSIHFVARAKPGYVLLNWQIGQEGNIVYFSAQHSKDNINFKEIGRVTSDGNVPYAAYSFKDIAPNSGMNYYRLKMVRKNGSFIYSDTVSVKFSQSLLISLSPNPANSVLHISGMNGATTNKLMIERIGGALAKTIIVTNQQHYDWDIHDLPKGVYTLVIAEADGTYSNVKFVKE